MTFENFKPAIRADATDGDLSEPSADWNDFSIVCDADTSDRWRQGA
jgi:hypothetical protein